MAKDSKEARDRVGGSPASHGYPKSPEEARIVLLEAALIRSCHTIEFLHGCLTNEEYSYEYPQATRDHLDELAALVDIPEGCYHSRHHPDCEQCVQSKQRRNLENLARKILAG